MPQNNTKFSGPLAQQAAWLKNYRPELQINERGNLLSAGDGIVWVTGLPSAAIDDILIFEEGSRAIVFDLTEDRIGAILLHETDALIAGISVRLTGQLLSIPTGDTLLGRVIDPLGTPLDGEDAPAATNWQRLETPSPPITSRDFVHMPLYTCLLYTSPSPRDS